MHQFPDSNSWDTYQLAIIESPPNARLLIDAPPGTGKTAVACARVAHLINEGVEPSNIWFMSFTRTAVAEIRDRIYSLTAEDARAAAVRIMTVDSHAWHLRAGFDIESERELFKSYDENIESVIGILRGDDSDVADYFDAVEHLVIDEAQDLVGMRADLVDVMMGLLNHNCGISVFTDDAQAIYGFSEDADPSERHPTSFVDRIRAGQPPRFQTYRLQQVYRADSESLREIFLVVRQTVLDREVPPDERLKQIIEQIQRCADDRVEDVLAQNLQGRDDILVLFRRRAEVLLASSFLRSGGVQHRVRMSGLTTILDPWIALIFWDMERSHIGHDEFCERWKSRVGTDPADAWTLLFRLAGERGGRLELRKLRARLSRSRPPIELSRPENGHRGPILGTIHASKGREAPYVHLMLPRESHGDDLEEECRVTFVGATRSRQGLRVGEGYRLYGSSRLDSGRVYRRLRPNRVERAQVEIGLAGDVSGPLLVSSRLYGNRSHALRVQEFLASHAETDIPVRLIANRQENFRHEICLQDGSFPVPLGAMSRLFNYDLWEIANRLAGSDKKLRPGETVNNCYIVAVSTHVLAEDDPVVRELYSPFAETGFFLTPVVSGFPTIPFLKYR